MSHFVKLSSMSRRHMGNGGSAPQFLTMTLDSVTR